MSVYRVTTIVGVLLCLLVARATGISSRIHKHRGDDNFVSLTCTDDFSSGPGSAATFFYNDSESGSKSLGQPSIYKNFTLNKTNEGRYTCKTTTNGATISTNYVELIPFPVKHNISSTQSFIWGKPLTLSCSYQPGVYPDGYTLIWEVRVGGTTKTIREQQQQQPPFSINSNTHELSVPFYTPLIPDTYQCKVTIGSLTPSNYNGDSITVSTEEKIGVENKILTPYPENKAIQVNDTYSFTCEATVRSNEMMTFQLFDTTMTATSNMDCHTNGNYTRLNCPNLQFGHVNANISCDFSTPYTVSCTYVVNGGLQEGNFTNVSCSIGTDKQTWKLLVRPTKLPKPVLSNRSDDWYVDISLPHSYDDITPNITIIIRYGSERSTESYTISTKINGNKISVPLRNNISGTLSVAYKISFFGETSEQSEFSDEKEVQRPSSSSAVPSPSTSSSSSSLLSSHRPTPLFTATPTTSGTSLSFVMIGIPVIVSVIIVIVLILIVVFLILIYRSHAMNRKSFSLTPGIEIEEGRNGGGASEHLLSLPNQDGRSTSETSLIGDHTPVHIHQGSQPCSCSCHTRSTHSRSSDPSHYSGNSYTHLNQDVPRYGYPDHNPPSHYHHHHQSSLTVPSTLSIPNEIPAISVQTPTPVMENVPISPAGTEPFNSVPNTPLEEPDHQTFMKARPQNLHIPEKSAPGDYTGSPVSDNVLLTVMLFLQHQNCGNRKTCGTCKLIKRQFEKIVQRNGQEAVQEAIKNIQTPGTDGHKHLRRREKRPTPVRSPMRSLGVKFERQRSHSTSHLHDEELTFSSTETEDDERTHRRKRQSRKAVTDDEYSIRDDAFQSLPLSAISKEVSLSEPDLTPTPGVLLPTMFFNQAALQSSAMPTKQETINSDDSGSTDDSNTSSRPGSNPQLDPEESIIPSALKALPKSVPPHLQKYESSSSGVYSSSDENSSLLSKTPLYPNHKMYPVSSDNELSLSDRESSPTPLLPKSSSPNHMTYLTAVSVSPQHKQQKKQSPPINNYQRLGPDNASIRSSPGDHHWSTYRRKGSSDLSSSVGSNYSAHSESYLYSSPLRNCPHHHNGGNKHRTPSPINIVLPSEGSSATPL